MNNDILLYPNIEGSLNGKTMSNM